MIKSIRGNSLDVWLKWLNKELTPPHAPNVAKHEDVRYVLHSFRELILKVKQQKEDDLERQLARYLEDKI